MSMAATQAETVQLDLTDVKRRLGDEVGGGELIEPCSATDIRRWVMAVDYPNPIHWDHDFAGASKFGGIVAPQSFAVAIDYGRGVQPACVGHVPRSHLIFGGEEWWHYGPRIKPGDRLTQQRRFHDYKLTDTKFAGPALFSRGDTVHLNQHGAPVSKDRSTSIRYLVYEAEQRGLLKSAGEVPRWTREQLLAMERERLAWVLSNREGRTPALRGNVDRRSPSAPCDRSAHAGELRHGVSGVRVQRVGKLPLGGPARCRGSLDQSGSGLGGWFGFDEEGAKIDPRLRDGLYVGPSRGHVDSDKAS